MTSTHPRTTGARLLCRLAGRAILAIVAAACAFGSDAVWPSAACAQATTATILGRVVDTSGGILSGATVTVTNELTGLVKSTVTNERGEFTLTFLPVGTYRLAIERDGFNAHQETGLQLSAAQSLNETYKLAVSGMTDEIVVEATPALINATNAQTDIRFSKEQAVELPIFSRDATQMLSLGAGVTANIGGTRGGVSINGLPPSGVSISLDGVDAGRDSEVNSVAMYQDYGRIKGANLEAIQEIHVSKDIFSAELGGTISGNVNVITRAGSNQIHGSLFEEYRSGGLQASDYFTGAHTSQVYHQFGGSFGGPIERDKLFVFGTFEGYRDTGIASVRGSVPTPEFRAQAIAAQPGYAAYLDLFPLPTQPATPGALSAIAEVRMPRGASDNYALVRGDQKIFGNDLLTVRYTRARPAANDTHIMAIHATRRIGLSEAVMATYVHPADHWSSETRIGFNRNDTTRTSTDIDAGASLGFSQAGIVTLGELFVKSGSTASAEHIVAFVTSRHSIKVGGVWRSGLARRLNFQNPGFTYTSAADFLSNQPSSAQFTFGIPEYELSRWEAGGFAQDDIRIPPRLPVNLGLRYDYAGVAQERDDRLYNRVSAFDSTERPPASMYEPDYRGLAPRASFAWKLDDTGATVLRGGFGRFVMPHPLFNLASSVVTAENRSLPFRLTMSRAELLSHGIKFPNTEADVVGFVGSSLEVRPGFESGFRNPYTQQWMLGIQREIGSRLLWEISYVGNHASYIPAINWYNEVDRLTGLRPVAGFGEFNWNTSTDASDYHALQTTLSRRFANGWLFDVNYTYANNMADFDGEMVGGARMQDATRPELERGPTDWSIRHSLKANFIYELPLTRLARTHGRGAELLLGGWQFAGILVAQSGPPFSVTQSSTRQTRVDLIGDPYAGLDGALGRFSQYLNPAAFAKVPQIAASGSGARPGTLGRNALRGPGLWNVDLALSKNLRFTDATRLQLRADLFNAFNVISWTTIDTSIDSATFGQMTGVAPLRRLQISARFTF